MKRVLALIVFCLLMAASAPAETGDGATAALREAGIRISAISGSSVGALNGALIAVGDYEKAEKLWQESFDALHGIIRECGARIIMLENYLCETKGTASHTEYFEEYEDIRSMNKLLESKYRFVKENYGDVTVISTGDCGLYYADVDYEHGCIPSQPSEAAAMRIAARIREKVFRRKG